MREQVKKLWKLCFNDSDEFTEMYFRLRYNNEVNIAIQSGEEVIAALQILPYPMTFGGKEISTGYVSGACTHPGLPESWSYARTSITGICPHATERSRRFHSDSGRALAIRLLCRYRLCTCI